MRMEGLENFTLTGHIESNRSRRKLKKKKNLLEKFKETEES